jgi:hypothetical protein
VVQRIPHECYTTNGWHEIPNPLLVYPPDVGGCGDPADGGCVPTFFDYFARGACKLSVGVARVGGVRLGGDQTICRGGATYGWCGCGGATMRGVLQILCREQMPCQI